MKPIFSKQQLENINTFRYNIRGVINHIMPVARILVSLAAVGSIVYYYGFPQSSDTALVALRIIRFSFYFYIFKYLLYLLLAQHTKEYIRENRMESIIIFGLIFFGFLYLIFGHQILKNFSETYYLSYILPYLLLFVQLYFLIIVSIEIGQASPIIAKLDLGPAVLLILSFFILILVGTGLLMMPEMTVHHHIHFVDALFTSASASCVTGLIVVDTATYFTFKGQMIIMFLIQLGGINIISFATFFTTFYLRSTGVRYQSLIKDFLSTDKFSDTRSILRQVVFLSAFMEITGSVLIYFLWGNHYEFDSGRDRVFSSVFHAISSFNNAGFSLFTDNLYEQGVRNAYGLQIVVAILVITGGLGFIALQDIQKKFSFRKKKNAPHPALQVNTRLVLWVSGILLLAGTAIFYFFEDDTLLKGQSLGHALITSFFQSVTARTAGFNTVDFGQISLPMLTIFMFLMYVGASPGSTGGGIKTTTFAVLIKSAIDTLRGKKNVEFFKRTISFDNINKAYSLVLFSIALIFLSTFLLSIFEPKTDFVRLLFEEISAFATVGLSTGITAGLSVGGKIIIIVSMLVGRVGPLTLALALSKKAIYTRYRYGRTNVMIG
ncbi:TrkH family potassium uptake protein [Prolixibacter denitrificans]|uniref:Potassium transporter n=1 Tax=Prolixibacter denitrificans TaxID=1541063 RepID=A0A2P8CBL6_9BACT|nr:potassium transporter TrkG [Prolixibacter denitrificans]PSK82335.1 potassium uptake TrkH family protein [Prolixibacter denitrificans]GET22921.1 potassium transporter [Prolixibacter denitrificans]